MTAQASSAHSTEHSGRETRATTCDQRRGFIIMPADRPDLRIWHGSFGREESTIAVSNDGSSFVDLTTPLDDCTGTFDPGHEISFTDFDIAATGLTSIEYVRVTDVLDASYSFSELTTATTHLKHCLDCVLINDGLSVFSLLFVYPLIAIPLELFGF